MTDKKLIANAVTVNLKQSTQEIDISELQVWWRDSGMFTGQFLETDIDLGDWDIALGLKRTLSVRNPNKDLWLDISKLHTKRKDSSIHGPFLIPPLTVIELTYEIEKDNSLNPRPFKSLNDNLEGDIGVYVIETSKLKESDVVRQES